MVVSILQYMLNILSLKIKVNILLESKELTINQNTFLASIRNI